MNLNRHGLIRYDTEEDLKRRRKRRSEVRHLRIALDQEKLLLRIAGTQRVQRQKAINPNNPNKGRFSS